MLKAILVLLITGSISVYGIYEYVNGRELNYWFGCIFLVSVVFFMLNYLGLYNYLTSKDEEAETIPVILKDVFISKEEARDHNFNYGRSSGKTDFVKFKMLSSELIKELSNEELQEEFSKINKIILTVSNSLILQDEYQVHDLKIKQDELIKEMMKRKIPIFLTSQDTDNKE